MPDLLDLSSKTSLITGATNGIWANPLGRFGGLAKPLTQLVMRSPEQGTETVIYLATAPEEAGTTGKYFANWQARCSSRASQDPEDARCAWQVSAALCGLAPHG